MNRLPDRSRILFFPSAWRLTFLILLFILPLCLLTIVSAAEENAVLSETEWTWEPGGTASFFGSFTIDGPDLADAVLTLELETNEPDHQGTVVFTEVNGKTVKIRKRSNTITTDLTGQGAENTFCGDWYLPEGAVNLNRATLRFRAEDAEGKTVVSAELKAGVEGEDGSNPAGMILTRIHQLKIILFSAACILWMAAIVRNQLIKRIKPKSNR